MEKRQIKKLYDEQLSKYFHDDFFAPYATHEKIECIDFALNMVAERIGPQKILQNLYLQCIGCEPRKDENEHRLWSDTSILRRYRNKLVCRYMMRMDGRLPFNPPRTELIITKNSRKPVHYKP